MTFEEWLDSTTYSDARKLELRSMWDDCGRTVSDRDLRKVKCFIKDETYPMYKFPRGIYSRCDKAKCLFGPLVATISKQIFGLKWFIKKVPVVDRPMAIYERLYKPGRKYCYTDYTSFEAHFTADLQNDCENVMYRYMTSRLSGEHKNICDRFATCKGAIQTLIFKLFTLQLEAKRMSGEMDTSLANGFANLMFYLFCCYENKIPESEINGYFEGDDGLVGHEGAFPTEQQFKDLGLTIKIGVTSNLTHASFCGQVYDVEDLAVVTDIKEAVCRFGWTNKQYVRAKPEVLLELLRAKGYSLAYQYGRCPILGALALKILELTAGVKVRRSIIDTLGHWEKEKLRGVDFLKGDVAASCGIVGANTRALVETLYGISVTEQLRIETLISQMTDFGRLPFQFDVVPKDWEDYFWRHNVDDPNMEPVWLSRDASRMLDDLIKFQVLTPNQAATLRAGWR